MGSSEVGDCAELLHRIWLYLDQETDPPTCAELEAHLSTCQSCRRAVQFDARFKQLVRRCADPGPVPAARLEALRARLEATLRVPPPFPPPS